MIEYCIAIQWTEHQYSTDVYARHLNAFTTISLLAKTAWSLPVPVTSESCRVSAINEEHDSLEQDLRVIFNVSLSLQEMCNPKVRPNLHFYAEERRTPICMKLDRPTDGLKKFVQKTPHPWFAYKSLITTYMNPRCWTISLSACLIVGSLAMVNFMRRHGWWGKVRATMIFLAGWSVRTASLSFRKANFWRTSRNSVRVSDYTEYLILPIFTVSFVWKRTSITVAYIMWTFRNSHQRSWPLTTLEIHKPDHRKSMACTCPRSSRPLPPAMDVLWRYLR